jgi:hypothetical protein
MRALCGAIISAGALIALGLWTLGVGCRYNHGGIGPFEPDRPYIPLKNLDTAFIVSLVILLAALAIGLGIAFVGLAYHHHRRTMEMLHQHQHHGRAGGPSERVTV